MVGLPDTITSSGVPVPQLRRALQIERRDGPLLRPGGLCRPFNDSRSGPISTGEYNNYRTFLHFDFRPTARTGRLSAIQDGQRLQRRDGSGRHQNRRDDGQLEHARLWSLVGPSGRRQSFDGRRLGTR